MREEEAKEVVKNIREIISGKIYMCPINSDVEIYKDLLSLTNLILELKRTKLIRGVV